MMYAAENRRTGHRLVPLDVTVPAWMRAPGEMPGMFAHEVAMDQLAEACGIAPVEVRIRNEPDVDPESGKPFSRRWLVECLQHGAERFGWADRPSEPGRRPRATGGWEPVSRPRRTQPCGCLATRPASPPRRRATTRW